MTPTEEVILHFTDNFELPHSAFSDTYLVELLVKGEYESYETSEVDYVRIGYGGKNSVQALLPIASVLRKLGLSEEAVFEPFVEGRGHVSKIASSLFGTNAYSARTSSSNYVGTLEIIEPSDELLDNLVTICSAKGASFSEAYRAKYYGR